MGRQSEYPSELRERAVRMVFEVTPNYPSECAAINAVASKLGVGTAETLRNSVRQAQIDGRQRYCKLSLCKPLTQSSGASRSN